MTEKKSLTFAFRQGFRSAYELYNMAEKALIKGPMAATGRGRFRPHFFKQGTKLPPFPQELKRTDLQGFPAR